MARLLLMTVASTPRNKQDAAISRGLLPWVALAGLLVYALGFCMMLAPAAGIVIPEAAMAAPMAAAFLCFLVIVACAWARVALLSIPAALAGELPPVWLFSWTDPASAVLRGPFIPPRVRT